jgi:3-oxoacyl-[acyl-carrier protein] reductase
MTMSVAYIALGSNLGDRQRNLNEALRLISAMAGIHLVRVSSFHETEPVGGPPGQGMYLNAAAELETSLGPEELLAALQKIERTLGRTRPVPDAPRTIDLDLLLYDDVVRQTDKLVLPHPRMHLRTFVLGPLVQVAPLAIHPVLGRNVAEIAGDLLARTSADALLLAGKRALVTGSTSGIGLAIAKRFAAAGARVIMHGRRVLESIPEITAHIQLDPGNRAYVCADLCDPVQCQHLADAAWGLWDGIDVLVNNAGADVLTGTAAGWSFDQKLRPLLSVDLVATILLGRKIGSDMKSRGGGVILNMGWDQAETGMAGDSGQLFATVKGAVMAFSKSLAASLAPEVRVNCLAPGWIRTAWGETASSSWQERAVAEALVHRWGMPVDVANVAMWLASDQASFVNGQIIRINGGAAASF